MKKTFYNKNGFTLIEVTLVLAVAGLIFLMMFVALPALNSSQRDSRRKEDISALISAIKKYQTNNRGVLPTDQNQLKDYLRDNFDDPSAPGDSSAEYKIIFLACKSDPSNTRICDDTSDGSGNSYEIKKLGEFPNDFQMLVVTGASCDGSTVIKSNNPRNFAVTYRLEADAYCEHS